MKKEFPRFNREDDEFSALNSELGSLIDLEPPKIYRHNHQENASTESTPVNRAKPNNQKKKKKKQAKQPASKAKQVKRRRLKKKVRVALSVVGVLLVVSIIVAILCLKVVFLIDTIEIKGNDYYTKQQISAVLPVEKGEGLFLCDRQEATEKLCKNLPYVYNVNIERKLPKTLVVNIKETPKVYCVKNRDKTYTLLDDKFKVLELSVEKQPKNSILISKLALDKVVLGEIATITNKKIEPNITQMIKVINELGLQDEITEIYCDSAVSCHMVYEGRITINFGTISGIKDKLYSALTAIEKINDTNPNASGELSSTGGKQVYFTEGI